MKAHAGATVFERHPRTTLAIVVLLSLVILDFLAANVFAAIGWYTPPRKFETYYRVSHPVYHHTLASNINYAKAQWGPIRYQVHTNSLGFKDREVRQVPLESDRHRVLFIGDSFTEALGYSFDDSFVGIVSRHIEAKGIEVLNAAVTSYSPIIYYRKIKYLLQEVGLEFHHVVALIDISDVLDEAVGYRFNVDGNVVSVGGPRVERFSEKFKNFLTENTILVSYARTWVRGLRTGFERHRSIEESLDVYRAAWTYNPAAFSTYGKRGLQQAAQHMEKLKTLLDSNGVTLTVVVYPWPDQIIRREVDSKQVIFWKDWARQHQAEFVDLFPDFINGGDPRRRIETYFLAGDVHWNEKGHALIANRLLERIAAFRL